MQANVRTVKRVPSSCKRLWSTILTRAMASAMFLNAAPGVDAPEDAMQRSRDAWAELLMLPKCVLAAATRSGKKHKHVQDRLIRSRLQQWADGD
eukprot:8837077-Pyramimonas_sp.AAC.1